MITPQVNIDFIRLSRLLQVFIREKAKKCGSTIVYKRGNELIEENPQTARKTVIKRYITTD